MKYLALTTLMAFLVGLSAAQVLAAGEQESGQSKSATQIEKSDQQSSDVQGTQSPGTQRELGAAGQTQEQQQAQQEQQVAGQQLNSDQIRQLQQSLQEKGADPGPVDGIMGPKTRAAIEQFQQQQGIAATGQPNQQTLEALDVEFMGVSPAFGEKDQKQESEQKDRKQEQQEQMQKDQQQKKKQTP